jgi:hypothetical protein
MNIDMSSKNTKTKTITKSQIVDEIVQVPLQKSGKKSTSKQVEAGVVVEPVLALVAETVQTKKSSKKDSTKQTETVIEQKNAVQSKKGGKKETAEVEAVQTKKVSKKSETKELVPNVESKIEVEDAEEQVGGKLRYFKLFFNDEYQGRYCGKKPKQAANKAFSSIIKDMKKNGTQKGGVNVSTNFSIRECTRNSRHKEYKYVGIREELNNPVQVTINNEDGSTKQIIYSFHNKIQKAPKA